MGLCWLFFLFLTEDHIFPFRVFVCLFVLFFEYPEHFECIPDVVCVDCVVGAMGSVIFFRRVFYILF